MKRQRCFSSSVKQLLCKEAENPLFFFLPIINDYPRTSEYWSFCVISSPSTFYVLLGNPVLHGIAEKTCSLLDETVFFYHNNAPVHTSAISIVKWV